MGRLVLHADPKDNGPEGLERVRVVPEGARLPRTSRRVVLRVEEQDRRLTTKIAESDEGSVLIAPLEIRGRGAGLQKVCHRFASSNRRRDFKDCGAGEIDRTMGALAKLVITLSFSKCSEPKVKIYRPHSSTTMSVPPPSDALKSSYRLVRDPRFQRVLRVQAVLGSAIREYLNREGFLELLPPIIGPVSDPGIRGAKQATINFYGREYKVMSSAILYKQMMAASLGKIYFFSPNVRLEPLETAATGRHLVEFVQVDVEEAEATVENAMARAESLLSHVSDYARREEALRVLADHGREVPYGVEIPWDHEEFLSSLYVEPFFIRDYPRGARGFYDREDPARPGILRD